MASTFGRGIEIPKFDDKIFSLWKEMMQDMLVIRRQVEAIRHNDKPASMSTKEWRSMDEVARSIIRMHLAENFYFNMSKETTTFSLWEKLLAVYEEILLIKVDTDSTSIQHEDERDGSGHLPHQHL